jgi:7,8-dihydroneopterin aldolase/epimerase/oxygenase
VNSMFRGGTPPATGPNPRPRGGTPPATAPNPRPDGGTPPATPRTSALDRICLTGLRGYGYHGVLAAEREQGQEFVVDVLLELDLDGAARTDNVVDTVHYGHLADQLVAVVAGEPVNLIETLADRLAAACLTDRRVTAATVTVHKPRAPIEHEFADVAVTLRRAR